MAKARRTRCDLAVVLRAARREPEEARARLALGGRLGGSEARGVAAGAVGRSILAAADAGRDAPMAHRPSGDLAASGLWLPSLGVADTDSAGLCAAYGWAPLVGGAGVKGPAPVSLEQGTASLARLLESPQSGPSSSRLGERQLLLPWLRESSIFLLLQSTLRLLQDPQTLEACETCSGFPPPCGALTVWALKPPRLLDGLVSHRQGHALNA